MTQQVSGVMKRVFECALLPAAGFGGAGCRLRQKVVLKQGRNIVGRGAITGSGAMRVSRRQLVLEWDEARGVLRGCCGRQGRATSFLLQPKKVRAVPGEEEGAVELTNGDKVTLNVEHGVCDVSISSVGGSMDSPGVLSPTPSKSWPCVECATLNATGAKHCDTCGVARYPTVLITPPGSEKSAFPPYDNPGAKAAVVGHFRAALANIVKSVKTNPNTPDQRVFYKADGVLIAYDAYPKGVVHLLGFLLDENIGAVSELTPKHLPQLTKLHSIGAAVVSHLRNTHTYSGYDFQLGYHCSPSLRPLHLHIMTTDLSSVCLKNRKHYTSFCPPYFIAAEEVERRLKDNRAVKLLPTETDAPTKGPMPCRWCHAGFTTIPSLKKHFETCEKNPNSC